MERQTPGGRPEEAAQQLENRRDLRTRRTWLGEDVTGQGTGPGRGLNPAGREATLKPSRCGMWRNNGMGTSHLIPNNS